MQFNDPTLSAMSVDNNNNNNVTTTTITMPHPTASNTTIIEVKESHKQSTACGNGSNETIDMTMAAMATTKRSLDFLQKKYKLIKQELVESRDRIDELEQSVVVTNHFNKSYFCFISFLYNLFYLYFFFLHLHLHLLLLNC